MRTHEEDALSVGGERIVGKSLFDGSEIVHKPRPCRQFVTTPQEVSGTSSVSLVKAFSGRDMPTEILCGTRCDHDMAHTCSNSFRVSNEPCNDWEMS